VTLGDGQLGSLRLGVGDKVIVREIASITRSLIMSLALCLVVGLSLALCLAFVLVRPVHELVRAANRIRHGDFGARAEIFSRDEIGRLALAFNQMAEGLETYREEVQEKEAARVSLIGKIVQAQEDERKSVARELHDQLGQSLSNTLLLVESHFPDCPKRDACENIGDTIRKLIDEVRQLAWDVRPSILDDYGLDSALARYVQEIAKRSGIDMDYQCVFPPNSTRLAARVEATLYRIAQEAITNIIRHAHATEASIILMNHDHEASLIIEDNGQGFDLASVESGAPPLGLIGMRERAALVGGEIALDSNPGKGTILRVKIPLGGNDANTNTDSG
jgi:signal transduction histidine kinase